MAYCGQRAAIATRPLTAAAHDVRGRLVQRMLRCQAGRPLAESGIRQRHVIPGVRSEQRRIPAAGVRHSNDDQSHTPAGAKGQRGHRPQ